MNAKQKMAYHAREYRRLKSLLVGDAPDSPTVSMCRQRLEQVQRGVSSTFRDIKNCRDSIRSARTHIKMTMDWFEDEFQSTDNPDSKKKIKEMIQNLRELDKQLKGKVL